MNSIDFIIIFEFIGQVRLLSPTCPGNEMVLIQLSGIPGSAGTNVEDSNAHLNVAKFGGDTRDSNLIISHVTLFTTK